MGGYVKHTQADSKTGRQSYPLPLALQPYLPKRLTELKRSLGAMSLADPKAASRYAEAQKEYARLC